MATCADCGEPMFDDEPVHVSHVHEQLCGSEVRARFLRALVQIAGGNHDGPGCVAIARAALNRETTTDEH